MNLDDLPDAVVVVGADQRVLQVNDLARRMPHLRAIDPIGRPVGQVLPLDDLDGRSWLTCLRPFDGLASRTRLSERSLYTPDGHEYLVTARIVRTASGGAVERLVVSLRDARVRNTVDRERSNLIAIVAHDLRSPLTGIKGFSSTLLTKWDRFTEQQRQLMLETVDAEADRLTRLITELLDAARIDAGRLNLRRGPVDVGQIMDRVLRTAVAAGHEGEVALDVADDLPVIWGDADRVAQVLTNLTENAARHGRGITAVAVEPARAPDGRDGVSVRVDDAGPGIDPGIRSKVFGRFWRTGQGAGSGLGLYIVRGIVDKHEGIIDIGTSSRGGASMRVWWPVNEPDSLTDTR